MCLLGACAVGIHGCKSAPVHAPGRSISLHIHQYSPQSTGQGRGDSEFSLSRIPTAQALSILCYFCFFQRQDEWLGLKENHPELFERAKRYEMRKRERYDLDVASTADKNKRWQDLLLEQDEDDPEDQACLICSL